MPFDALCGGRLREERERLGLSQQAVADLITVQRAMVSRYERGVAEPGASVLMKLAGAGIDVSYVLFGARTPAVIESALTPEKKALLENYDAADEEGRAAARRVLSSLAQPRQKAA